MMEGTLVPGFYPIYSTDGNWSGHVYIDSFSYIAKFSPQIAPSRNVEHSKLIQIEKETQLLKEKFEKLSVEYALLSERYKTIIDLIVREDQSHKKSSNKGQNLQITSSNSTEKNYSSRIFNDDTDYSMIWKDSDSESEQN